MHRRRPEDRLRLRLRLRPRVRVRLLLRLVRAEEVVEAGRRVHDDDVVAGPRDGARGDAVVLVSDHRQDAVGHGPQHHSNLYIHIIYIYIRREACTFSSRKKDYTNHFDKYKKPAPAAPSRHPTRA